MTNHYLSYFDGFFQLVNKQDFILVFSIIYFIFLNIILVTSFGFLVELIEKKGIKKK